MASELTNSRIYWITAPDAAGLVTIVTTRPFDVGGNNGLDWRTRRGVRLSNKMHHTQATERLAKHAGYRKGTSAEIATIYAAADAAQAAQEFEIANPSATVRQLDYLVALGVEIPAGKRLTQREASVVIEAATGRESIGTYGLFYADGSN